MNPNQTKTITLGAPHDPSPAWDEIGKMVSACMQCGTCSGSCPNAFAMDFTPRQMWRMIQFGLTAEVLRSKTFWLCSSCYACTMRCPRGLSLTGAMAALKRLAQTLGLPEIRKKAAFYRAFVDNIHTWGRVQEMSLMMDYFLSMKDPLLPLSFTPVGLKLLRKGKLHPPSGEHKGRLSAMFAKVAQMEGRS